MPNISLTKQNLNYINMVNFEKIVQALEAGREDAEKFYNDGIKARGAKVRKLMQEIKKLANDVRAEVQNIKNEAKTKAK
jgi:hypothetical protein